MALQPLLGYRAHNLIMIYSPRYHAYIHTGIEHLPSYPRSPLSPSAIARAHQSPKPKSSEAIALCTLNRGTLVAQLPALFEQTWRHLRRESIRPFSLRKSIKSIPVPSRSDKFTFCKVDSQLLKIEKQTSVL